MRRVLLRALLRALLLAVLVVLVPWRSDAMTVVPPGDGVPLHFGESVVFTGHDKAASTEIRFWDGAGSYSGCFPQPDFAAAGDWQCQMSGPWRPGAYPYEIRIVDSGSNQIGAGLPVPFTVVSVLQIDDASLVLDTSQPLRVTGKADPTEITGLVTRKSVPGFRLALVCDLTGSDDDFVCVEPPGPSTRTARTAVLPAANDYVITISESDVEIGPIGQLSKSFSVVVPGPGNDPGPDPTPTPTPVSTPTPAPPTATGVPSPTTVPTPTPTSPTTAPTATPTSETSGPPLVLPVTPPRTTPIVPPPLGPDLSLLVGLLIAAFTTLTIAGGRAFSSLGVVGAASAPGTAALPVIPNAGADDDALGRATAHRTEAGWGDRSWTWRLPGHALADRIGLAPPRKVAPRSPLVGRVLADAGYLRSILGIAWLLPMAGAGVLAVVALGEVGARPVPPATGLMVAVILLACVDALAGALAVVVFSLGVLLAGGLGDDRLPDVPGSIAVLIVLALLWMALPLIGSATRPFRRRLAKTSSVGTERVYAWDRVADTFIAAALCGWIAYKLTQALAPFAGLDLAITDHALVIGLATAGGVVLRIVVEEVAEHGYPQRLHQVEIPGSLPDPTRTFEVAGALGRTAMLGLMAYVFLGSCWQLWVGMAMVGVWQVASAYDDKLPRSVGLGKVLPRGITKILVMLLVGTVVAALATDGRVGLDQVRDCFVIMAVPASLLAGISLFAEPPKPARWTWAGQLAGVAVYASIVLLVLLGW